MLCMLITYIIASQANPPSLLPHLTSESQMSSSTYNKVLSQADDFADRILRHSKHYLPHIARLCLIATFLEDGLRMWFQWQEQKDYISLTWRCGEFLAHTFVLLNMVLQLVGCGLVLVRKFVYPAVGMLFAVVIIQVGAEIFNDSPDVADTAMYCMCINSAI